MQRELEAAQQVAETQKAQAAKTSTETKK